MKRTKKIISLVLSLIIALCAFSSCAKEEPKPQKKLGLSDSPLAAPEVTKTDEMREDFKIGFICLHADNSTYDKNFIDAINSVQSAFGLTSEQVIIKTNIPEGDDCYVTAKDLAEQGCDIVFANSFGHEEYMLRAAKEYPDVQFCQATGIMAHTEELPNFHNAFAHIYQARYITGIVAGMKLNEMIASGEITKKEAKLGYVGAFSTPEIISGYSAFYLGAKSVCPTVTMQVEFVGSWFDTTQEKKLAEKLIKNGALIISQHTDSLGVPEACEKAGIPNIGYNQCTYDQFPETFLISSSINWAPYLSYIIIQANLGEEIAFDWCGGISEGSIVLSGLNQDLVAEGTLAKIEEVLLSLETDTLHVFDTSKFTVEKKPIDSYLADVDKDENNEPDTEAISKYGYFKESSKRSAPYFDILEIDGITAAEPKYLVEKEETTETE